ncbi:MAG TPA: hypothetical protein VMS43_14025 [Allosphingosinicella sp.]|nr:hypothetical protein [Allosphingosinicella sp.]
MATFVLTAETQLVRQMEVHDAAKKMASRLGMAAQVETRVGDFRHTGWSTGWTKGLNNGCDVLVEVYVVPLTPYTLSMETENLVLRRALDEASGQGTGDRAVEAYRSELRERDEDIAVSLTPPPPKEPGL